MKKNIRTNEEKRNRFILIAFFVINIAILLFSISSLSASVHNLEESKDIYNTTSLMLEEFIQDKETDNLIIENSISITAQPEIDIIEEIKEVPVVEPLTDKELYISYVYEICELYPKVDPYLVQSVIFYESSFNPKATTGKCHGLMQVSARWHQDRMDRLGITDIFDPYGNILVGVDYLNELIEYNGDLPLSLMLYNMVHTKAREMYSRGEISNYAQKVLARAEELRR